MKKTLILLFSTLISFNSLGEWVETGGNDGGTSYIDFNSMRIVGDSVYVWSMMDMPIANEYGVDDFNEKD